MKNFYFALLGLLALSFFGSCKKEAVQVAPHTEEFGSQAEVVALGIQLEDFSNQYVPREETELRGFWRTLRKLIYVIASDATGAIEGYDDGGIVDALRQGVASSVEASKRYSSSSDYTAYLPDGDTTKLRLVTDENPIAPEIGSLHNLIIQRLKQKYVNLDALSEREVMDLVVKEMESDPAMLASLGLTPSEFERLKKELKPVDDFKIVEPIYDGQGGTPELIKAVIKVTDSTEEEARILTTFVTTVVKIDSKEDIVQYANGFNKIVSSAPVSKELKNEIALFTSVASNSAVLWEEK